MIPEHRLSTLMDQVKETWISNCLYHNTASSPSLYLDHECSIDDFPRRSVIELRNHADEVWCLKYSHDGTKLATAGGDKTVVIYETATYKVLHTLTDHESGVCCICWSPDDTKLISCTKWQDSTVRIWNVQVRIPVFALWSHTNRSLRLASACKKSAIRTIRSHLPRGPPTA